MKKLLLSCIVVGLSVVASAQKVYFLYFQTEDLSPFYVRMADKIYSSSTVGYLILPNLTDSTYLLGLGFPKSTQPETRFSVTVNQNDKGYLIKNFTDGLSLFDMQDLSIVKAVSAVKDNTVYETKTDKFSSTLSKAADDPGLLRVPVAKKEELKPKPEEKKEVITTKLDEPKPVVETLKDTAVMKPVETVETTTVKKDEPIKTDIAVNTQSTTEQSQKTAPKEEPVNTVSVVEYKPSTIVRRSESSTTEGFGIVFYDKMEGRTDTIRILIPPSKSKIDGDAQTASLSEIEKKPESMVPTPDPSTTEVKLDSAELPVSQPTEQEAKTSASLPATSSLSSCKENASEKDFMKLRKNMAAKDNDEAMIDEAKKTFKNKCFSVEQLRYLSTLFLTSAAKYQFFDASYNHVFDKQNFSSLQSEIKDEYYLKRFKALVGE